MTANTQIPIADHPLNNRVEDLLLKMGFKTLTVTNVALLKQKNDVAVSRIHCTNGHTLIAKHIHWDKIPLTDYSFLTPALQYESCNYHFLASIAGQFPYMPELLGELPGLLLLQDLGEDNYRFPDEASSQYALLDCMAQLHVASHHQEANYSAIKNQFKIPAIESRKRILAEPRLHFEAAKNWILQLAKDHQYNVESLMSDFIKVEEVIDKPAEFSAFLHNDFVSRRQAVVQEGRFYLLDFEHSQFGHALQEVAKLYVGKMESNLKKGIYFRKRAPLVPRAASYYKTRWEHYRGQPISQSHWEYHLAAAMVYQTIAVIGGLVTMPYDLKELKIDAQPVTPLTKELEIIGATLLHLLEGNPQYTTAVEAICRLSRWVDPSTIVVETF